MKLSSVVRFNATLTVALAALVGIIIFIQSVLIASANDRAEACSDLRHRLNEMRIVLYETGENLDRKSLDSASAMLSASVSDAEAIERPGILLPGKKRALRDHLEMIRIIFKEIAESGSSYSGQFRSSYLHGMRQRAQNEISVAVDLCVARETEFSRLRARLRTVTSGAVIVSIALAASAALVLSLFFSRRIENAVGRLVKLSTEIASGKHPLPSDDSRDEFSPVYDAMHSMDLSLQRVYGALEREEARLRRIGNELRDTTVFLDKVVSNASAPIVVWNTDFSITMFNRAFERLTGYLSCEVIGKKLTMLFSESTAASSYERIRGALDGEQWDSVDIPIRRKDGSVRIVLWNSANILDDGGTVAATVAQGQDITDRMENLRALTHSERRFRMLFAEMQLGFALHEIVCDASGRPVDYRFLEVNPAFEKILGLPQSVVVGHTVREVLPGTEQHWIDVYGEVALTGRPRSFENYSGEFGRHFEVVSYSPERGKFAALFNDVTERRRAEEKIITMNADLERKVEERTRCLEAYTRELEAFSYSVSHDLRAPLRSIEGFGTALEEDFASVIPEAGRNYIRRIRNATSRMGTLIDDLLNLSRITRAEINVAEFDISEMVRSVFTEIAAQQPRDQIELTITPGIRVCGDERLVRIVIMNLALNAWKFTSRRGAAMIRFYSIEENGKTVCVMSDNGAGFDMKWYDKLFGAFQRLHTVQEFPGTGIGLAIAQRVISKHGGTIRAESEPGKGASFFFTLS